jgi:ketosteroid isomerase-like protein
MKKFFMLIASVCIAFSLFARQIATKKPEIKLAEKAAAGMSADEEAMGKIVEDWKNAYNGGDAAKVAALYSENGYYLSAHILAHGREAIEAYWRRGIIAGGHIDFIKPLIIFCSGDLGYTAGIYQATNAGVTVDGRILIVLKKVNGRWLIAAHETVVRDQP